MALYIAVAAAAVNPSFADVLVVETQFFVEPNRILACYCWATCWKLDKQNLVSLALPMPARNIQPKLRLDLF